MGSVPGIVRLATGLSHGDSVRSHGGAAGDQLVSALAVTGPGQRCQLAGDVPSSDPGTGSMMHDA